MFRVARHQNVADRSNGAGGHAVHRLLCPDCLRVRNGFEMDIAWEDGQVTQATIRSRLGNPLKLRYETETLTKKLAKGDSFTWNGK